jgi:GntR family transcriptional regulator
MLIKLDPRNKDPIYQQVVEQIRQLVTAGQLKPWAQLPTVRQLAVELRVNPNTIARAYTQLAEEGVISTQQGRGTYVLDVVPTSDPRKVRREKLVAQVDQFLSELERLGYTPEEIEKAWSSRWAAGHKAQQKDRKTERAE